MDNNLYNAFKILRESGILLERDMTPEQREAAKRRRQARRAEAKGKPVSSGNWAVMVGNGYPTPDFFKSHKPVGTSDAVLQIVTRNLQKRDSAELLGLYPTRKKAKEVAEEVLNRLMSMHSSAYGVRYNCPEPTVVEYVPENKRWCDGISGPRDCGYLYDRDKEIAQQLIDLKYERIHDLEKAEQEKEDKEKRDREWANSSRNPDSGRFMNVFKHH